MRPLHRRRRLQVTSTDLQAAFVGLRTSILRVAYAGGPPFDDGHCTIRHLYPGVVNDPSRPWPCIDGTDRLFFHP